MATATQERRKQVALSDEMWLVLKIASARWKTSMKEIAERAILKELQILKELDGKPRK